MVLISRNPASCGGAADAINAEFPGSCKAFPCDVADAAAVEACVKEILAEYPTVDILVEVRKDSDLEEIAGLLTGCGYTLMSRGETRLSFNMGYTDNGFAEKVYHLHLRLEGDHDELYFRDYLMEHADTAREYEKLKLSLWKQYEHNRDGYTSAKTDFVQMYTEKAKLEYGNRYQIAAF